MHQHITSLVKVPKVIIEWLFKLFLCNKPKSLQLSYASSSLGVFELNTNMLVVMLIC